MSKCVFYQDYNRRFDDHLVCKTPASIVVHIHITLFILNLVDFNLLYFRVKHDKDKNNEKHNERRIVNQPVHIHIDGVFVFGIQEI